ncbi:MAG: LUD domain-containing protein [Candidatus Cloacimonetes bacterium]|nr:LUD domain-containing protein [Candidatus Cloacimonadota bacterium]
MKTVDELDFSAETQKLFEIKAGAIKRTFEQRRIQTQLLDDEEAVKAFITEFIAKRPEIKSIAFSDGVTLYQLDLFNWIQKQYGPKGFMINQPLERSETGQYAIFGEQPPGRMNIPYNEWKILYDKWYDNLRMSLLSDLLIVSANAVTMNGEIISVDGLGNRVSGMIFGPRHVLCIVGRNKIVNDQASALDRIHNHVVPLTYLRHNLKHWCKFEDVPCLKIGKCVKCSHPESSCLNTVVVRGQVKQHQDRLHLIIVNQDLGF